MRGETEIKNIIKSSGWFLVALITCPCHLFLLLPLIAGTALGSYFTEFKNVIFIMMGLLFVFALFKGWRKLDPETKEETKKDTTTHDCCSMEKFK
ncbi:MULTISPECIES: mercury resistance MerE [Lactobacillales]|uniref:mercury resistance MerE n=1 Tax=Lactobacillales TaxID=186826 RepID=UPI001082752A|nr:mercury resistance MerE [Enterococcus faecium]